MGFAAAAGVAKLGDVVHDYARDEAGLVFAASRYGNLYRSEDNGDTWERLWREFSEVSSIAWLPD